MAKPLSLEAFSVKRGNRRGGFACWTCTIPERAEIDEARRKGTQIPVIREWLIQEKGYLPEIASRTKLDRHFSVNRHHERGGR